MTRFRMNPVHTTLAALLFGLFLAGSCPAQISGEDFGTVKHLKQCPEYKRGYDPYASLSGTLRENVDVYSGKLNLTFPLPTVPWGATKSFGAVLMYNSNVWMKQELSSVTVGGAVTASKTASYDGPTEDPRRPREKMSLTFPEYWCNDAWVKFSPIGKPHAMPGWTLTVGGVYTEYAAYPEAVWGCISVEQPVLHPAVKKKFFVAPDGSSHLLVDAATNCRPHYTKALAQPGTSVEDLQEKCTGVTGMYGDVTVCMPWTGADAVKLWRAVDGSAYYYVEKQLADTLGDVYAADGTRYVLDGGGMVKALIDADGNTVTVNVNTTYTTGPEPRPLTRTVSYHGGSAAVSVVFRNEELPHWVPVEITQDEWTWEYAPLECWLLERVDSPVVGGAGTQAIHFGSANLVNHLQAAGSFAGDVVTWADLFLVTTVPDPQGDFVTGDFEFCRKTAPPVPPATPPTGPDTNLDAGYNNQVHVLTGITLPDGRAFAFQYNRAGKIKRITYPDGGCRVYWYGNTPARSHMQLEFFRIAKVQGESALGGVSFVWQGDPDTGSATLEQALAYSKPSAFPTATDVLTTVVAKGDRSVEVHEYLAQPSTEETSVLKFGFSGWKMGKPKKVRRYDFTAKALELSNSNFLKQFICFPVNSLPSNYIDTVKGWLGLDTTVPWKQEEEYAYANHDATWHWTLPDDVCHAEPCDREASVSCGYDNIIYVPALPSPGGYPESGNVMTSKVLRLKEGGQVLEKRSEYGYGNVTGMWLEPNALKLWETETDWYPSGSPSGYQVQKEYAWHAWWPWIDPLAPVGALPARLLAIPREETVKDAGGAVLAKTVTEYPSDASGTPRFESLPPEQLNPADFHPAAVKTLVSSSPERWAKTSFAYAGSPLRLTAVNTWEGGAIVGASTFAYEAEAPKLLKQAVVYDGAREVQYMLVRYDPFTGLLLKRTDKNGGSLEPGQGNYVKFDYDAYNRLQAVSLKHAVNGAEVSTLLSSLAYSPATARFQVTRRDYLEPGTYKESVSVNDAYGRPERTWATLGEEGYRMRYAASWKVYDALGRAAREYGPAKTEFPAGEWNAPYTQLTYDALGRVTKKARYSADGAAAGAGRTDYGLYADASMLATPNGTTETVYDEANRWRKLYQDGFGRIVRVDEPAPTTGTWRTDYGYDRLGNLTLVNKRTAGNHDGQIRTFTYDHRGKLLSAALPEFGAGVFRYLYDDGGNLLQKWLDSNGQQVYNESLSYDGLGRLLTRSVNYGEGMVSTAYTYDVGAYAWGKLSSDVVTYPGEAGQAVSIARSYDYEWFGALKTKTETILLPSGVDAPDNPYLTRYAYGSTGQLTKVTYPSGVAKELFYGAGGGLSMMKVDGEPTFAGMTSAANGATETVSYGTASGSVSSARVYDPTKLWPVEMKVGPGVVAGTGLQAANVLFGLSYGYEANGNVTQMNRYVQATPGAGSLLRACNYAYDTLNRLSEFTYDQVNHYHYAMDEFGNLLAEQKVSGGTGAPKGMAMPVDVNTNRLAGKPYDNLGNQVTTASGTATLNLAYWDQGHVSRVWGGSTGKTYHYYYDAEGKRRIKLVRADGTQAVLGWTVSCYEGEDLACEQDQGDRVQPDAAYASKFLLTDHLGTTRAELRIDPAGQPSVTKPTDTMPYGELIAPPPSSPDPVLFTGKQRDQESGMDFFGARFYNNTLGRWNSPDQPFADNHVENPQSWNIYSYVQNNPVGFIDKNGFVKVRTASIEKAEPGGCAVSFIFKLDKRAPADGYIVQKNVIKLSITSADGRTETREQTSWEAWKVKKDTDFETGAFSHLGTDLVSLEPQAKSSKGSFTITGEIKFFTAETTGNLGDPGNTVNSDMNGAFEKADPATGWLN